MMEFERGSIHYINLNPQKRKEEISKIRPAIIISDTDLNQVLDLVTIIPLTTNLIDDALPLRIRIEKRENLEKDSDAMIEQIRAVSKSRIENRVAKLNKKELELVENGIKEMLNLF
jgi:mRNA interferase MazF